MRATIAQLGMVSTIIGYAVVYPWCCHLLGVQPWGLWTYVAVCIGIGVTVDVILLAIVN